MRKKAKYLHDAPPEALRPVLGPQFNPNAPSRPNGQRQRSNGSDSAGVPAYFSQSSAPGAYGLYSSSAPTPVSSITDGLPFATQQSPISPSFQSPGTTPMGTLTVPQVSGTIQGYTTGLIDPGNSGVFNFNLEDYNFGSQYAAMEFGMLGHLSSGAAETPRDGPGQGGLGYSASGVFGTGANPLFDPALDFMGVDYGQGNLQHGLPHAYAIAAAPPSLQSPSTETDSPQPTNFGFEGSPTTVAYTTPGASGPQPGAVPPRKAKTPAPLSFPMSILGKRQRDPSSIYTTVTEPYKYVHGFHKLIALLNGRFSANKILRIAKSLSSIRPSFIACARTLNREDLIFMEKSFQRSLFEYEDFMFRQASPAIVCRRTGEVALVNKEFTALTGWTKDVLLGKAPNLNVNTGTSGAGSDENSGRAGLTTPMMRTLNDDAAKADEGQPQPLFIAELMDDDSVIEFYEDFAHLAFGDSRGSVTRKCRLLKYRTREMLDGSTSGSVVDDAGQQPPPAKTLRTSVLSNRVARIDGEHGISRIEKDGKLECSYCWHIRRDTFDIPMMIVVNVSPALPLDPPAAISARADLTRAQFLPCYYPNQEPHQLAV